MADNFDCRGNAAGAKVILIDDVATTGSTLSACAEALKRAGAGSVWGLTLARQVKPGAGVKIWDNYYAIGA